MAGLHAPATHRAPKGREHANEYWRFCLDHVREYNNSYNFFAGMSDDAVAEYQKDALTGHRPTWKMGLLGGKRAARAGRGFRGSGHAGRRPFSLFGETGGRTKPASKAVGAPQDPQCAAPCARTSALKPMPSRADIKSKFKSW